MAAIAWSDVLAVAPELATVAAGAQTLILAHVNACLSPAAFGGDTSSAYALARAFLAAHYGSQAVSGGAGDVSSQSAGGLSISYAAPPSQSDLALTSYGLAYLSLCRRGNGGPAVL